MRINFVTNIKSSQIVEKSEKIWQIHGIPMTVDNAVMNGVMYEKEENAKGLVTYRDKPVALQHPLDENGNPTSAGSGKGLFNNYSGGVIINTYNHNGINYADAEFNLDTMIAQGGDEYAGKIKARQPIGVSTGLYFDGNNMSGIADNGDEYYAKAINQQGDHLALLPDDEAPAGGDATFIRFNGENNEQELTVNIDTLIASLSKEDAGLFDKLWERCKATFAVKKQKGDNSLDLNSINEGDAMRDTLIAALKAKGISVNAEISDAELLDKYNQSQSTDMTSVVNSAINPLIEEVKTLKAAINAGAEKELADLATAYSEKTGVEIEDAKKLGVNSLHKALASLGVKVSAPNATNHQSPIQKQNAVLDDAPWEKE